MMMTDDEATNTLREWGDYLTSTYIAWEIWEYPEILHPYKDFSESYLPILDDTFERSGEK